MIKVTRDHMNTGGITMMTGGMDIITSILQQMASIHLLLLRLVHLYGLMI